MQFSYRLVFFTFFLLSLLQLGTSYKSKQKNVVCLFKSESLAYNGKARFRIEHIEPATSFCTHIVYAYLGVDRDTFEIKSKNVGIDLSENGWLGGISKTADLKKNNTDLKIMVSVGGPSEGTVVFSDMARDKFYRQKFVTSVKNFLQQYDLDGLDLAWTYPAHRGGRPADRDNMLLLVRELKKEFKEHRWVLSVTIPGYWVKVRKGYLLEELSDYADFFNVQSFEYNNYEESSVKPFSPLGLPANEKTGEYIMDYLKKEAKAPLSKLNFGISALFSYVQLKANSVPEDESVLNEAIYRGLQSDYLCLSGYIGYNEVCMLQSSGEWRSEWNQDSSTSFLIKDDKVISYDSPRGVEEKASFAVDKRLGGVFFNRIDLDDFRQDCQTSKSKFPLLKAVANKIPKIKKACGRRVGNTAKPLIVNGKVAEYAEFPWHAVIYRRNTSLGLYALICGGTLISSKVVVSAAHCFGNLDAKARQIIKTEYSLLKVAVGTNHKDYNSSKDLLRQVIGVDYVEIPQQYLGSKSLYVGDIAFVTLKIEVEMTRAVQPICIDYGEDNFESNQLLDGSIGVVVGFGRTGDESASDKLITAKMPYVPQEECRNKITANLLSFLTVDKICAGGASSNTTVCSGDSGGGLVFYDERTRSYYLRGIVSLGGKCRVSDYVLFTKLSYHSTLLERFLP